VAAADWRACRFQRSRLAFILANLIFKLFTSFLACRHLAFHWSRLFRKNGSNFETGLRNDDMDILVAPEFAPETRDGTSVSDIKTENSTETTTLANTNLS
jgi:hypothetical protein